MASTAPNSGYSLPPVRRQPPEAASILRAAAVVATTSSYELPVRPRRVVDEGEDVPCCISCALSAAMEILNPTWPVLAPLFHYHVVRFDEGGADAKGALYLNRALQTLVLKGICRETLHEKPYTDDGARATPSAAAFADAASRALGRRGPRCRIVPLGGSSHVTWIREQLLQNRPVVMGIQLPVGYRTSIPDLRCEWLDPATPLSDSGHCLLVTGYNDALGLMHVLDCHGTARFKNGYWWMGYRVVDSVVVQELYALVP